MRNKLYLLSFIVALAFFVTTQASFGEDTTQSGNTTIYSFSSSKTKLHNAIYKDSESRIDIYCGCRYDQNKQVDSDSCGYVPEKNSVRSARIEWEHAVAAEMFGKQFKEWTEGHSKCVDKNGKAFKGRKCAEKVNREFSRMQADMYNLYPAVGEVNGLRSNYPMAVISEDHYRFGECKTKIEDRKIEPRPEVRGDIARTYFYMDQAYPHFGFVNQENEEMFKEWDKDDPVDQWECERARRIAKIQKNINHIVNEACEAAQK